MRISATIGDSECELEIISSGESNQFSGILEDASERRTLLSFTYDDGIITNLEIDNIVDTDPGIVLERLVSVFREITDSRQMGFEVENIEEQIDDGLKPYDPELIRVRPVVLSAFQVHRDITKGKIDLNPDFQRNFVWSDAQKSLLIESMLLKIPLPAFYFAEDKFGKYQVVDGLQRLTVINQYLNNEFKLKKLQYLHHLEGKYFSQSEEKGITSKMTLEDPYEGRVEGTQLNINVIESSSPLRVKYDIFYRINTGGRPLNRQEIRNCFATERTRRLLKRMVTNNLFQQATDFSVKDTRMDAQELALRFCGFLRYREDYTGEMSTFLDDVLEKLSDNTESQLANIESMFFRGLSNAMHLFGKFAFRKVLPEHIHETSRKQFLNKAMFIVWTVLLANVEEEKIIATPDAGLVGLLSQSLEEDRELFDALTTGTTDRSNLDFVFGRFSIILTNYLAMNK